MDQGDHGDHGAGWWTRSTVVPLLHFADGMEQEGCRTTTIGKQWKVSVVLGIAGAEGNIV